MSTLFWILVGLVFWHYLGYGLVLWALARIKKPVEHASETSLPTVSIVIVAHNEENVIARRIENCLNLDYPPERIELLVCSDASTDRTADIARAYEGVRVIESTTHHRARTQKLGVEAASGEIVCFTDANSLYEPDCIRHTVLPYVNPRVGGVTGALRSTSLGRGAIGSVLKAYWHWECQLRLWQSRLGVLLQLSGGNMSVRRSLYQLPPEGVDIDQATGPFLALQGYVVEHSPTALAHDEFAVHLREQWIARRRVTIQALTALWHFRALLNPLSHPVHTFHRASYRLLRYFAPPLLLGIAIVSLLLMETGWVYQAVGAGSGAIGCLAIVGVLIQRWNKRILAVDWALGVCWLQLGMFIGLVEFLCGKRISAYTPAEGRVLPTDPEPG